MKIGDKIKVKSGLSHSKETAGKSGTVKIISTEALGVEFDNMPGKTHKWYVKNELLTRKSGKKMGNK